MCGAGSPGAFCSPVCGWTLREWRVSPSRHLVSTWFILFTGAFTDTFVRCDTRSAECTEEAAEALRFQAALLQHLSEFAGLRADSCVLCTSSSVSRHYFKFSCIGIHAVIAGEHWQVRTGAEGWWLMIKRVLYIQFNPANNSLIPNTQYSPMKCLWPDASWNRNTAINLKIA